VKHNIPFTEYVLPHGRQKTTYFQTDNDEVFAKAQQIIDAGYVFEIETLRTGEVSATIVDPVEEMDAAITVMPNDIHANAQIAAMIMKFDPTKPTEKE